MQNFEPIFADDGYRPNVGIIICNRDGQVFWARRINKDGWQFPQGGVSRNESLMDAMYRELQEETGLNRDQVRLVAHTKEWLHYDLPRKLLRNQRRRANNRSFARNGKNGHKRVNFKGQKQVWFLLELIEDDSAVDLAAGLETPEFDSWRWVDMHHAVDNIVDFKKSVYKKVSSELGKYLPTSWANKN